MFNKLSFVISSNESNQHKLRKSIENHKGKVQKTITKNVKFYIQSWNTDDEGKLGKCADFGVSVVSSDYIFQCIALKSIIPLNLYSINEYKNDENIWNKLIKSALFVEACKNSLEYESIPQTIQEFTQYKWPKTTKQKNTIYILPITSNITTIHNRPCSKKRKLNNDKKQSIRPIDSSLMQLINDFVSAYFQLNVVTLDSAEMNIDETNKIKTNMVINNKLFEINCNDNDNDKHQKYEVCDIIDAVLELYESTKSKNQNKSKKFKTLKHSGYCIIGVTNQDIFENDSGFGILRGRAFGGSSVAVFSTYDYDNSSTPPSLLLLLNTIGHELLHCFGQDHCIFYSCIMNAWSDKIDEYENNNNNKRNEDSVSAMHLCPIDLKKLQSLIQFDVKTRYEKLKLFYDQHAMKQQSKWITQILSVL